MSYSVCVWGVCACMRACVHSVLIHICASINVCVLSKNIYVYKLKLVNNKLPSCKIITLFVDASHHCMQGNRSSVIYWHSVLATDKNLILLHLLS